jgi:hypothetical protein
MHAFPVQISGSIVIRVNFVAMTSKVYAPPMKLPARADGHRSCHHACLPVAVDPDHSEWRYMTLGDSTRGRVNLVAHLDRGDRIRIISARRATRKEAHEYEEER